MDYKITRTELLLLRFLRMDSRKSLASISKETSIPISTLFEGLKRLKKKVKLRHTSLLNYQRLGYNIRINFILQSRDKRLKEFLMQNQNVNTLSSMMSSYYAECVFRNFKEVIAFKEKLEEFCSDTSEIMIIDELKREEFIPFS
ncbi:hypothetical protein KY330_04995 [Candidatus Woesearchaeota archaeon]|nr:hypothetical protein [Candidatus Woesearchaeota archaeon]